MPKPSRNAILILTARFETMALAVGRQLAIINGGAAWLEPSFQFETPHSLYGRMIKVTAMRVEDGACLGAITRVCADEKVHGAISVGGANVPEEFRREGVATALYDFVERVAARCDAKLVSSDLASDDAKAFWKARRIRPKKRAN